MHQPVVPRRLKFVVGLSALIVMATASPAAAEGDLRIEADAVYQLNPGESRLEVTVDFLLTNQKPSTTSGYVTTYYYFDSFAILLPDEADQVTAIDGSGRTLEFSEATEEIDEEGTLGRVMTVVFPRRIYYRDQQVIVLSFHLPGGAPRSESTVRVNPAYAAFGAWAWGDPGLSDVTIRIPPRFEVNYAGDDLDTAEGEDYRTWFQTGVENPHEWGVFFTARYDEALISEVVDVDGLAVTVRSWPGDEAWAERVGDVVLRGLPALQEEVGLGFGDQTTLEVVEALDPSLLGYAGWYLTDQDVIEMGEHLDDHTILHEISHLWINDDLFITRWINEGLAEEFAATAFDAIDGEGAPELGQATRPPADPSIAVPLNRWELPLTAPSEDDEAARREDYGYNAAFWVVHTLRAEIGTEAVREVLTAAAADLTAYPGGPTPETVAPTDGWWRFLDLLEEIGGSESATGLFREFVVAPEDLPLLEARGAARAAYATLIAADGDWETPWAVRRPLGEWEFPAAEQNIAAAEAVVLLRDQAGEIADRLDLTPPPELESTYEAAESRQDLAAATGVGEAQLESVTAVSAARDAVDEPRGFFATIGLLGEDPVTAYLEAATAFEEGRHADAGAEAAEVVALIDDADDVGRGRVLWAVGILILVGAGIAVLVIVRRRRGSVATPEV